MSTMMPTLSANQRLPAVHLRRAKDDPRISHALIAEFFGVAFFQLLSATVAQGPLQTALSFAAIMYSVQWISGGHLNPAVSLAALGSGHIDTLRGLLYIIAQILGAVVGAFVQVLVTPGEHFGKHSPTACFRPVGVNGPELFGWEFLLTTFFIMVMYAGIFAAPGHGSIAPLASGLALFGVTATGGMFTGFSPVNPARVLAAMLIFHCNLGWGWTYLAAQLAGAGAAIVWAWFMYGKGTWFGGVNPDAFSGAHGSLGERLLPGGGATHDPASAGGYGTTV